MNFRHLYKFNCQYLISGLLIILSPFLTACGGKYTEQVSKVVGSTKFLAPSPDNELVQGFEAVTLSNNGVIQFKLIEKNYAPEFEAPLIRSSTIEGTKANPVGTVFATFFTLGLYPILETRGAINLTAGQKLNETLMNEQPDLTKQKKTGKFAWLTFPMKTANVVVSGLKDPIHFKYDSSVSEIASLDISQALLEWTLKYNTDPQITIECQNCINNSAKENLPSSQFISFSAPDAWKLEAKYRANIDIVWAANKNINYSDSIPEIRTGNSSNNSWNNILSKVNSISTAKLQEQLSIPTDLAKIKSKLINSRPQTEITISQDEFESTVEFKQRQKKLENLQKQKLTEYNQQVDELNKQIANFQAKAPTKLTKLQTQNILINTIQDLAGDPIIRDVRYDPDLKRLFIKISGASQKNPNDLIQLVSTGEIFSNDAKKIKENTNHIRVYVGFNLINDKLILQDCHIHDGNKSLRFQMIDKFDIPELKTAKIVLDNNTKLLNNLKVNPETSKVSPNINLSSDPEIAKLRQKLEILRGDLIQKQQNTDKDLINTEIKDLETKLKAMDEGSFNDDLKDIISISNYKSANNNIVAVVVGITDYYELPKVIYADRSADAFSTVLQKQYGVPERNISLIKNQQATGLRLLERLRKVAERTNENQIIIFYFAGHGAPSRDGKSSILIPSDASGTIIDEHIFRLNEIYKILLQSKAKQVLVVLDSCFSGLTDQNEMIFKDIAPILPKVTDWTSQIDKRLVVLAGSGPSDFAHAFRTKGYRLFTYHLIKEMSSSKGIIKSRYPTLVDSVLNESFHLVPSFEQKPMWIGGEFNLSPAP